MLKKLLCVLMVSAFLSLPAARAAPPPQERGSSRAFADTLFQGALPLQNRYVQDTADRILRRLGTAGGDGVETVEQLYRYIIETTAFGEPAGMDVWRWRDAGSAPPDFVECRAISPLLFGIGSCEDYAAALVVLLRRAGFEAEYVPGLTISIYGGFVDHAWAVVKVDGVWYHIDPQLEDNVTRHSLLTYRYFLKSGRTLYADHRWGENLAAYYGNPDNADTREILENWTPPDCPQDAPAPQPRTITQHPLPDRLTRVSSLEAEKRRYEEKNGSLPPLELPLAPPNVYLNRPKNAK